MSASSTSATGNYSQVPYKLCFYLSVTDDVVISLRPSLFMSPYIFNQFQRVVRTFHQNYERRFMVASEYTKEVFNVFLEPSWQFSVVRCAVLCLTTVL